MKKSERNYGIDLLRVIAMFLVIVLHSLGQGGILKNANPLHIQYKAAWALEIAAYCAVDLFALISGYVMWGKETKYQKYVNLWLEVTFYSLLITACFNIFKPEVIKKVDYIKALLPVTRNAYWYFTAYTGLFLVKPLLDKGIQELPKATLKKIFIIIIAGFSIFETSNKMFITYDGYSAIWLIVLYILGAVMSKCEIGKKVKTYQLIIAAILLYGLTCGYFFYGEHTINAINSHIYIAPNRDIFINYTSPTILGIAMLLIIGISRINFKKRSQKIITFLSASAFAVYLLNNNRFIWQYIILDMFAKIANSSVIKIYGVVIGFSLAFTLGSILIDKLRILVFKLLRIDKLSESIIIILDKLVTRLSNII